jgi:VWFA-related protein
LIYGWLDSEEAKMWKLALTVLLIAFLALTGVGQSGRVRSKETAKETIRLSVQEVLLPVSVKSGPEFKTTTFQPSDFTVVEDGAHREVNSLVKLPASVLLIIDNSSGDITFKNLNLNIDVALGILKDLPSDDKVAALAYGDKVDLISDWTLERAAVAEAIKWKVKPKIKSHLYDALLYAAETVLPKAAGPRIIVLISDGVDGGNASVLEQARPALERARATIYVVAQNSTILKELKPYAFGPAALYAMFANKDAREKLEALRRYGRALEASVYTLGGIADQSGGILWDPKGPAEFKALDGLAVNEIGTEYMMSYNTERSLADEDLHRLQVYSLRLGVQVRSRRAVYGEPQAAGAKAAAPASK